MVKMSSKYVAKFAGQALGPDGKVIDQMSKPLDTGERTVTGTPMIKLLENSLKLAKDDELDGIAVIVITKEGEMQMAYHANNASLLHLHGGRLMHEIEKDVFEKPLKKRTLLA